MGKRRLCTIGRKIRGCQAEIHMPSQRCRQMDVADAGACHLRSHNIMADEQNVMLTLMHGLACWLIGMVGTRGLATLLRQSDR